MDDFWLRHALGVLFGAGQRVRLWTEYEPRAGSRDGVPTLVSGQKSIDSQKPYTGPCPPTREVLAASITVREAFKEAFKRAEVFRSLHGYWVEHGGWIYWKRGTRNTFAYYIKEPAVSPPLPPDYPFIDRSDRVWLNNPPPAPRGWEIVAQFHIHNVNVGAWEGDDASPNQNKVPGLLGHRTAASPSLADISEVFGVRICRLNVVSKG